MTLAALSRPARMAAQLTDLEDEQAAAQFLQSTILVRLDPQFADVDDAVVTLEFTINQLLRFCRNIVLSAKSLPRDLVKRCRELAREITGTEEFLKIVVEPAPDSYDAVLTIGSEMLPSANSVTTNSTGWVARIAAGKQTRVRLPWTQSAPNALGALSAACSGVGAIFLAIIGRPLNLFTEFSLFSNESALPGNLPPGPLLPKSPVHLNAFLVGCGAVSSGWAYAAKRLPITGELQAIDPQSLREENLGPYVIATLPLVGQSKAATIKSLLAPGITVTAREDHWETFTIRLRNELTVPTLVISGLDRVGTRHSVQRIWPETLIDLGSQGLESQVIVKHKKDNGQCLLNALKLGDDELDWAEAGGSLTGLDPALLAEDPTGEITEAEVEAAPAAKREQLRAAVGKPRCGYLNGMTLGFEEADPNFASAAPFVSSFAGIKGAAETMKLLLDPRYSRSVHFQKSFRSGHTRAIDMRCAPDCECQRFAGKAGPIKHT